MSLPFLDVGAVSVVEAADALEAALASGLDPEAGPPRAALAVGRG